MPPKSLRAREKQRAPPDGDTSLGGELGPRSPPGPEDTNQPPSAPGSPSTPADFVETVTQSSTVATGTTAHLVTEQDHTSSVDPQPQDTSSNQQTPTAHTSVPTLEETLAQFVSTIQQTFITSFRTLDQQIGRLRQDVQSSLNDANRPRDQSHEPELAAQLTSLIADARASNGLRENVTEATSSTSPLADHVPAHTSPPARERPPHWDTHKDTTPPQPHIPRRSRERSYDNVRYDYEPHTGRGSSSPWPSAHDPLAQADRVRREASARLAEDMPVFVNPTNDPARAPGKPVEARKPDKFAGDPEKVITFIDQVKQYARISPHAFRNDSHLIDWASSYLQGAPYSHVTNARRRKPFPDWLDSWPLFVHELLRTFGPGDVRRHAIDKLVGTNQTGSVTDYYNDFMTYALDTGFNEPALVAHFVRGLSPRIRGQARAHGFDPETVADWQVLAQRIEYNLTEYDNNRKTSFGSRYNRVNQRYDSSTSAAERNHEQTTARDRNTFPQERKRDYNNSTRHNNPENTKSATSYDARNKQKSYTTNAHLKLTEATAAGNPPDEHVSEELNDPSEVIAPPHKSDHSSSPSASSDDDDGFDFGLLRAEHDATLAGLSCTTVALARNKRDQTITVPVLFPTAPARTFSAIVDTGATRNFIDPSVCNQLGLVMVEDDHPIKVSLADRTKSQVTHYVLATLLVGEGFPAYTAQFYVFPLGPLRLVLGIPFCNDMDPAFEWRTRTIRPRDRDDGFNIVLLREDATELPHEFRDFIDVFDEAMADVLPRHSKFDHAIDLIDGKTPPWGPLYRNSTADDAATKSHIDDNLRKGFIRHSTSSCASPVLNVPKKDGTKRTCIDYRALNAITVKVRYPLPRIDAILDRLHRARLFSKIDLRGAYNLLRIRKGDEWKTAFRTQYGLYEYRVMPFGLCNAPASFQRLMNHIFRDMIDHSIVVYLDDILIYTTDRESHITAVREVLLRLRKYHLYAKLPKCEFFRTSISFLGYVIDHHGISMDPAKVDSILHWPYPRNARDILSFVGLANFYRNFVPGFAQICRPLYDAANAKTAFVLTRAVMDAWQSLKTTIASNLVVRHFDPTLPCTIETDASDYALGAVLSQHDDVDGTRPVAFASRKMTSAELNYPTHDKELLAIVYAFTTWKHYLEGLDVQLTVYSDHRSLEYFQTQRLLSRRQARWSEILSVFNFTITYRPGRLHQKADALSRRPDYQPADTDSSTLSRDLNDHNVRVLLPPEAFLNVQEVSSAQVDLATTLHSTPLDLDDDSLRRHKLSANEDGLYVRGTALYVPESLRAHILRDNHDDPAIGHPGVARTYQRLRPRFWWPGIRHDVQKYVSECLVCQQTKIRPGKPYGLLRPLPVAERPWQHVSADFVGPFPVSNGHNFILVVVDRFTKMAIFIPTVTTITAEGFAELFFKYVYARHGLPSTLVTDRGSVFTSKFWQTLARLVGLKSRLSTAYHPQTDGQSETVNKNLEQYLHIYTDVAQANWSDLLPHAEFCYNSTPHTATGISPYAALTGAEPRRTFTEPPTDGTVGDVNAAAVAQRLALMHRLIRDAIVKANVQYTTAYNRAHQDTTFVPGDYALVSAKNIKSIRPSKKLDNRFKGPFKVNKEVNSVAYELDLPRSQIGNVFHVSRLKHFKGTPPPQDEVVTDFSQSVLRPLHFLRHRTVRDELQHQVEWDDGSRSWETPLSMGNPDAWHDLLDSYVPPTRPKKQKASPWPGWAIEQDDTATIPLTTHPPRETPRLRPRARPIDSTPA